MRNKISFSPSFSALLSLWQNSKLDFQQVFSDFLRIQGGICSCFSFLLSFYSNMHLLSFLIIIFFLREHIWRILYFYHEESISLQTQNQPPLPLSIIQVSWRIPFQEQPFCWNSLLLPCKTFYHRRFASKPPQIGP